MVKSESLNYKLGRNLSTTIFNIALNPEILNKNLIPTEGSIILCGNHLHVWDQFPVMTATNRTIHWLAKKEYFDSKLGFAFKFMECIPVDREGNTNTSKEKAIDYLKKGSAVGIFPEGTRNGLKDKHILDLYSEYIKTVDFEQFEKSIKIANPRLSQINLLLELYNKNIFSNEELEKAIYNPNQYLKTLSENGVISTKQYEDSKLLKLYSGAIKMAKETNSLIVPFGVTGDYNIGNDDLMVSFGEPFSVENMEIDEGLYTLRQKMLYLVKNNEETNYRKKQ